MNARSRQFVLRYKDGRTVQPVIPPYGNSDRWFIFCQAIELIDKVVDFCF
ncbi:MAG: hypothetical protein IKP36_07770 [Bacteroidaceae bacterium]|nr:hypothetical protein [Bacteroidaceae bacterium]